MISTDEIFDRCWIFIREDASANEFEGWVYETSELQSLFSEGVYMTIISTDYSSTGSVLLLKRKLEEVLDGLVKRDCYCHTLSAVADVGMEHTHIFKSLDQQAKYGDPLWWLWLAQCNICEQFWMVGSEERINDIFFMKRLSVPISQEIVNESIWPDDFKTYASLLKLGKERGHSVRFLDPTCTPFTSTIIDLARAKPGIKIQEISELLQVNLEEAKAMVAEAIKNSEIKITL